MTESPSTSPLAPITTTSSPISPKTPITPQSTSDLLDQLKQITADRQRLLVELQQNQQIIELRTRELHATQRDLQVMGEKLIDEVEKRAEIQHAKEAVQDELEQLTSQLFEEANILVAAEAKRRFQLEKSAKKVEDELQQTKARLEFESAQLNELRKRLEASPSNSPIQVESVLNKLSIDDVKASPIPTNYHPPDDEGVDPVMLSEFVEMVASLPSVPMTNISKLPYMKSTFSDDIEPCLNFGGNPVVSVKKVIEAMLKNSCFVMEGIPNVSNTPIQTNLPTTPTSTTSGQSLTPINTGTLSSSPGKKLERSTWEKLQGLPGLGPSHQCQACGKDTPGLQPCKYSFRLSEMDPWSPLCHICRDRIVSTVDLISHIRNVKHGLFGSRPTIDLYRETLRLKRIMFYARCGVMTFSEQEVGFGRFSKMGINVSTFPRVQQVVKERIPSPLGRLSLDVPMEGDSRDETRVSMDSIQGSMERNSQANIKVDVTSVLLNSLN